MSKVLFTAADLVRLSDGTVDEEATVFSFQDKVANHLAEVELETGAIAEAVSGVFDKYKGARMNMPYIVNSALTALNVTPGNSKALTDRVHAYIQENSDRPAVKNEKGDVVTEAEPAGTRLFNTAKGKGGGVRRNADVVTKPATA